MAQGVKTKGKRHAWGTASGLHVASILLRNVPTHVRAQFKAYCARREYTMGDALIELMKVAANQDMRLPGARKKENKHPTDTDSTGASPPQ